MNYYGITNERAINPLHLIKDLCSVIKSLQDHPEEYKELLDKCKGWELIEEDSV